ncbi:hypothetical protein HPB51_021942 [Rhipicephalus microplus]|uniref:Uncharacterized protein n=1 Tax=Rhipicephalus microplus TaxID=6941 RepID=A0A9J6F820_RHIMP|nr:hypothetical protein HPB51_021942 [Rhipicephalus microplus]
MRLSSEHSKYRHLTSPVAHTRFACPSIRLSIRPSVRPSNEHFKYRISHLAFRWPRCLETLGLKPLTYRAFGRHKEWPWNKKAPATSAPLAAELKSQPDPLDLLETLVTLSTDDVVGPSSTCDRLLIDAAYDSTVEQARVEKSAQRKTVWLGKSATQPKFNLLEVSAYSLRHLIFSSAYTANELGVDASLDDTVISEQRQHDV